MDKATVILELFKGIQLSTQLRWLALTAQSDITSQKIYRFTTKFYNEGRHQFSKRVTNFLFDKYVGKNSEQDQLALNEIEQLILFDRNMVWLKKLDNEEGNTFVIIVGSDHLGGSKGLLNLLHSSGWNLSRHSVL